MPKRPQPYDHSPHYNANQEGILKHLYHLPDVKCPLCNAPDGPPTLFDQYKPDKR